MISTPKKTTKRLKVKRKTTTLENAVYGTKYSRIDQVKSVEDFVHS